MHFKIKEVTFKAIATSGFQTASSSYLKKIIIVVSQKYKEGRRNLSPLPLHLPCHIQSPKIISTGTFFCTFQNLLAVVLERNSEGCTGCGETSACRTISQVTQGLFLFSVALVIKRIQMPNFEYRVSLPTALEIKHLASALTAPKQFTFLPMDLNLEKHLPCEARLAWGKLGRMCHGTTPTEQAVIEALHQLLQVHIMN